MGLYTFTFLMFGLMLVIPISVFVAERSSKAVARWCWVVLFLSIAATWVIGNKAIVDGLASGRYGWVSPESLYLVGLPLTITSVVIAIVLSMPAKYDPDKNSAVTVVLATLAYSGVVLSVTGLVWGKLLR